MHRWSRIRTAAEEPSFWRAQHDLRPAVFPLSAVLFCFFDTVIIIIMAFMKMHTNVFQEYLTKSTVKEKLQSWRNAALSDPSILRSFQTMMTSHTHVKVGQWGFRCAMFESYVAYVKKHYGA